jgi:hypothetical protein
MYEHGPFIDDLPLNMPMLAKLNGQYINLYNSWGLNQTPKGDIPQ